MPDPVAALTAALTGRYRVEKEIGAGGMATVYRAQDLRHDRPVALKVLRPDLSAVIGVERFLAEIKTTANLQHAHILGLIDSGEVDGTVFYVMPFVDGESLRTRLTREKQIAIPDAVRIATAVAGALDYAHRRGIIHRDIKPENILLHDGQPLVADFGIALAMTRSGTTAGTGSRMTESGMSLGTPQYMSPEQAAGERNLDARTDIYALGCVLYEMLTGEPPFSGPTAQAIIAKVMTVEPEPVTTLRRSVPANVAAATMTALNKVPADRFATAAEFAAALANPQYVSPESAARRAASRLPQLAPREMAGVVAIVALAIVAAMGWFRSGHGTAATVARFEIPYDAATSGNNVHFSPDGSELIWSAGGAYWSRRLDSLSVRRLRDAALPNSGIRDVSPDGHEVLLTGQSGLAIASLTGGPARELSASAGGRGGAAWANDGYIYLGFGGPDSKRGIARVPAAGGPVDTLATFADPGAIIDIVPLPGGRGLIVMRGYPNNVDSISTFDLRSKKLTVLSAGGQARYVSPGYLLFASGQYLMAAPFNAKSLEFSQPPTPFIDAGTGISSVAASAGALVYRVSPDPQGDVGIDVQPVNGPPRALPNVTEGIQFSGFAVSPDGKRFVATGAQPATPGATSTPPLNLYVYELPAGPMQRFNSTDREAYVAWMNPRTLAFVRYQSRDSVGKSATSTRPDSMVIETTTLLRRPWDGSAAPDTILSRTGRQGQDTLLAASSWYENGTRAIVQLGGQRGGGRSGGRGGRSGPGGPPPSGGRPGGPPLAGAGGRGGGAGSQGDLMLFSLGQPRTLRPFATTEFAETNPAVRPDGKLVAFQSNSSGRNEVYVSPIDGTWRRQISPNGGAAPKWSRSGNELYFRVTPAGGNGTDTLYSARIQGTADISVGEFKVVLAGVNLTSGYAALPGDSLFLMHPPAADAHRPFIVVMNFVQELDRLFAKK